MKKHITYILFFLFSQTVIARQTNMLFNADSTENKFWNYFESQVNNLDSLPYSLELQKRINDKLAEFFPGLGFGVLMNFKGEEKVTSIYITAYGDRTKFTSINQLVAKAPKKFNVQPYNPSSYLKDSLTFNNKTIPTDQIEFSYKKNKQELDISLYFPSKPAKEDNEFGIALQTLLLDFVGELQFANIGIVDIYGINQKTTNQQTAKLKELYIKLTTELK